MTTATVRSAHTRFGALLGPAIIASLAAAGAHAQATWTTNGSQGNTRTIIVSPTGSASGQPAQATVTRTAGQDSESSAVITVSEGDTKVEVVTKSRTATDADGNQSREETSETRVFVDGKEIAQDRVRRTGTVIEVLDDAGTVMRTVNLPQMSLQSGMSGGLQGGNLHAFTNAFDAARRIAGDKLRGRMIRVDPFGGSTQVHGVPIGGQPKVMLGITMDTADAALAEQLQLNPEEVTVIGSVTADTPASRAGLKEHDVIVSINGQKPASPAAVRDALRSKEPGQIITLGVVSGGGQRDVSVTLDAYDAAKLGVEPADDIASMFRFDAGQDFGFSTEQIEKLIEQIESGMGALDSMDWSALIAPMAPPGGPHGGAGGPRYYTFQVPGGAVVPTPPIPPGGAAPPPPAPNSATGSATVIPAQSPEERIRELEARIRELTETMAQLERRLAAPAHAAPAPPPPPAPRRSPQPGRGA